MPFPDLEYLFVGPSDSLRVAMDRIQTNAIRTDARGAVLVVNESRRLLGVLTDGDIRRALLHGLSLDDAVFQAMTSTPVTAKPETTRHQLLRLFEQGVRHIPIVDDGGRVLDLVLYSQFTVASRNGPVVVCAKAPLRLSFAGGGSDFGEHFEYHGGAVISITIDRYCHGMLVKRYDQRIVLHSYDYNSRVEFENLDALTYDGHLDLIKATVKLLKPTFGFELYTYSDVPPGSGLGASSMISVVVIGLFNELSEDRMDEYQISDLAYQAERIELGVIGGWQDQYAGSFGGLNFIEFSNKDVIVHPLRINDRVINELENNLLLCFTGITRKSGEVHAALREPSASDAQISEIRKKTGQLALQVKNALARGDLELFGRLLDEAWHLKKQLGPHVTNGRIEHLYEQARKAGALGGKLLGAGEGGYLLFYCPGMKRHHVKVALANLGVETINFNFDFRGLRVWQAMSDSP